MKVKICGIMTEEAARAAVEAGADLLGFVFAPSSRRVKPQQAAAIGKTAPAYVKKVGVFVNETPQEIERIAGEAALDFIQLHGDESPQFCREMPLPVIKAFTIRNKADVERMAEYDCAYYLVDSPGTKYRGGSGKPFDWTLVEETGIPKESIILAGGLNRDNVAEAIRQVNPAAVDVSSGVETDGKKDNQKIRQFIIEAKQR